MKDSKNAARKELIKMFKGLTVKEIIAILEEKGWAYIVETYEGEDEVFAIDYNIHDEVYYDYANDNIVLWIEDDVCVDSEEILWD